MSKNLKKSLVSSTPLIRKAAKSPSLFEIGAISPINPNIKKDKGSVKRQTRKSKPVQSLVESTVITKKRRCVPKKEKECASNAVLREMGVKIDPKPNVLSLSSHNLYLYSEPILLDSDEEFDINIDVKNDKKNNVKEKLQQTNVAIKKENKENVKEKKLRTIQHTNDIPKPSCSKSRVTPLCNLETPNKKLTKKQAVSKKETDSSTLILNNEDNIFSDCTIPNNLSSTQKRNYVNISSLEDIDKDAITWTPRNKTKKTAVKEVNGSELKNIENIDCKVLKSKSISDKSANCRTNIKKGIKRVLANNENVEVENSLPRGSFSCFAGVTFKRLKQQEGCTIASSLVTEALDFGYLELNGNASFTGTHSNRTFVLLEGRVKACYQGTTLNMCPGDIIRIQQDLGYQFHNLQSTHARFLYVKEKLQ